MLKSLTLAEIAQATGGTLVPETAGDITLNTVSTDTRTLEAGALFVALVGENFDGHTFLTVARERGAGAFVVSKAPEGDDANVPYVLVSDTTHALGSIARLVRNAFTGPVIGVTGSVGKTTTKELLALVLGANFNVLKSEANHNNEIGVPQTIFALNEDHTALVVEMGMRGEGQIRRLCEIAAPTIGVITNIGVTHLELLGSQENIAKAKAELFNSLPENGTAIYPADDKFATTLSEAFAGEKITVATDTDATIKATEVARHENGWRFTVTTPTGTQKCFIGSAGQFNVQNALFAIAVGENLGIPLDSMAKALLRWEAPAQRLEVLQTPKGVTVLSDVYNAAPDSMVGALNALRDTPLTTAGAKRIAVLGEMKELGTYSNDGHALVGQAAARLAKPDMLVLVGAQARWIAAGAIMEGFNRDRIHQFEETEQAARLVPVIVRPGDVVLVKGSRAMAMEVIVGALMGKGIPVRGGAQATSGPLTPANGGTTESSTPPQSGDGGPDVTPPPVPRMALLEFDDLPAESAKPDTNAGGPTGS